MTKALFYQLNEELLRISDDAVSPSLVSDPKAEIKQAFYIAQCELLKDILRRDLIDFLVIEGESDES